MPKNYSWEMLNGNILFKRQNYPGSCFAAAYQILCANLSTSNRVRYSGIDSQIEDQEHTYMLAKQCDIDQSCKAPNIIMINEFVSTVIDPLSYSENRIRTEILEEELYELGQNRIYTIGYILYLDMGHGYHAQPFFIKQINGADHFISLNSSVDPPRYLSDYALPCNAPIEQMGPFGLGSYRIHGGMTVLFN